mgnify:CR=1 FL=1
MQTSSKKDQLFDLISGVLTDTDFELILLEYKKEGPVWVVRLFIDHPDGVKLEHCENVTRLVSDTLDEADLIPHAYQLEVSSPGVDRPLTTLDHFRRFVDERIAVRCVRAVQGAKSFVGTLVSVEPDRIEILNETDGKSYCLPLDAVAKATLKPILDFS